MSIFYSDVEPVSKYSVVMLHLSFATRILNDNPVRAETMEDKFLPIYDSIGSFNHLYTVMANFLSTN